MAPKKLPIVGQQHVLRALINVLIKIVCIIAFSF